ncbi:L-lactate dehydrogenase [Spizellomyces punctatus DAOM BR117]|uniref:L-lactate dehydrogenase n=1 Tax=Spizellomyces punctatus (strain DAOM BR117) TaxID=645134 RepID=A0A0L0HCU6_SPIPD|nr:L-lactate dehydrogenase [Spizellomyces punctatus DAOM BR117]KNC98811.1 L-lactate dehydrogenase [Spizellomyces punctatus DAOM BR117]|eukprot:XP_016606851.1 L-lactate dehydrogenase [Spizellomyces punctatus DAOM BR117]
MPAKIAIIGGAGSVGATAAYAILLRRCASELLLVDLDTEKCAAQVLDLSDAAFLSDTKVRMGTPKEAGQCDIVIITAGAKQRPGETRVDLIGRNRAILSSVIESMKPFKQSAILLLIANPVDVLTYFAQKLSGLPQSQVLGSGTYLDSARLRSELSSRLEVAETAVHAYVLGEHGDSQFVAWSSAHVANTPLLSLSAMKGVDKKKLAEDVKNKAYKIIEAKGATYFGIGGVAASICECIIFDLRHVRPLSHYIPELNVCLSFPVVLGHSGVRQTLKPPLTEEEEELLKKSAKEMRNVIEKYELAPDQ